MRTQIKVKDVSFASSDGFSLIELLIVMLLISIMSGTIYYYLNAAQDLYKPEEQALSIIDIFQEARQRSLTQRETLRVEIDLTDNMIRLIDENTATTANDDVQIRQIALLPDYEIKVNERPPNISYNPSEEFPVPSAQFRQSIYQPSLAHDVCTIRFLRNGTVADQGTNEVGINAVSTGLTLHVWSPQKGNINEANIARAITVVGSTGAIRLWEYDKALPGINKWKDTRRTSLFGGGSHGEDAKSE